MIKVWHLIVHNMGFCTAVSCMKENSLEGSKLQKVGPLYYLCIPSPYRSHLFWSCYQAAPELFDTSVPTSAAPLPFPHIDIHQHCSALWMIAVINGHLRGPCWWRVMQHTPTPWFSLYWRLLVRKLLWQLYCPVIGTEWAAWWRVWVSDSAWPWATFGMMGVRHRQK